MQVNKSKTQELQALHEEQARSAAEYGKKIEHVERRCQDLESQLEESHGANDGLRQQARDVSIMRLRARMGDSTDNFAQTESALKTSQKSKDTTQSELDDLLIVFGDLEEKVAQYKVRSRPLKHPYNPNMLNNRVQSRLKKLGEEVSDEEDEGDDDSDGNDDVD